MCKFEKQNCFQGIWLVYLAVSYDNYLNQMDYQIQTYDTHLPLIFTEKKKAAVQMKMDMEN